MCTYVFCRSAPFIAACAFRLCLMLFLFARFSVCARVMRCVDGWIGVGRRVYIHGTGAGSEWYDSRFLTYTRMYTHTSTDHNYGYWLLVTRLVVYCMAVAVFRCMHTHIHAHIHTYMQGMMRCRSQAMIHAYDAPQATIRSYACMSVCMYDDGWMAACMPDTYTHTDVTVLLHAHP